MPWALSYKAKPAACRGDGVHVAADCVSKGIGSTLIPMVERIALGAGLGMAVGVALCLTVPG
jgi:hypothetical protein